MNENTKGNSNAFKAIIALVVVIFGVFAVINYTSTDTSNRSQNLEDSSGHVAGERKEGVEGSELSAEEAAVVELCDCFKEVLALQKQVEQDPQLEFELDSKIKKAAIEMRSCYSKTKQRHSAFGESLIEGFEMACPEAQNEL